MFYTPHKLYLVSRTPMTENEYGDPITNTGTVSNVFLCDCFLHDVNTQIKNGYAGMGIDVNYRVNIDRRDDLEIGDEVIVYESDEATVRGEGKIVDIKNTSGMQYGGIGNYMTIFI